MSLENSSGDTLNGQNYNPRSDRTVAFTQRVMDLASANALLGDTRTEIIPHDKLQSIVRVYTPSASDYEDYSESMPGTTNLQLPDILTGIVITYNKSENEGENEQVAGFGIASGSGSFSFAPVSSAQAGASIIPNAQVNIQQVWAQNVPVVHYGFFMAVNSSSAQILARLTAIAGASVFAWPVFRPESHTLTLKGAQVSISQTASLTEQMVFSDTDHWSWRWTEGAGISLEGGVSINSIRIPPTLHGIITPTGGTSSTATATTSVSVSVPQVSTTTSPALNVLTLPYVNTPTPASETITASVTPTSLAATTPSALPTTGLYLLSINPGEQEYGYLFMVATVFDFADLV